MRHARAFGGPGRSTVEFRISSASASRRGAVECRQFGDQLRNGYAEFGCSRLEHIRGVPVDLDTDLGVHDSRIADPETAGSIHVRPANDGSIRSRPLYRH